MRPARGISQCSRKRARRRAPRHAPHDDEHLLAQEQAGGRAVQHEVHGQDAAAQRQEVREEPGGAEGQAQEGHRAGQHGGRQDLRAERDPREEPGTELPAAGLAHGRRGSASTDGHQHGAAQGQHERSGQGHGHGHGVHERGEDLADHGPVREALRGHGRALRLHGGRHEQRHVALDARRPGGRPHSDGRGRERAQDRRPVGLSRARGHGAAHDGGRSREEVAGRPDHAARGAAKVTAAAAS
ncbi:hypothetical protein ON010_g18623 [Phytophthora cinnamomi]|nr:hypothetical protein ON010_g18623 [Phytophthora cinnamomi]